MARTKKLTDPIYSPTNPTSQAAIRAQIDDSIQEVYDQSSRNDATVNLTGNQSVAGIKTFSSSPIVPTPTTDLQVSTKKYVDDRELAIEADFNAKDAQNVKLTGNQTITDVKTFSSSPIVPTPTTPTQSASKGYVDTVLSEAVLGAVPDDSLQEIKQHPTVKTGQLSALNTTNKSNFANAINEVVLSVSTLDTNLSRRIDYIELKTIEFGTTNIPTTGWVANVGDNLLKLNLAITGVLSTHWVDISIGKDYQDIASDAEINPTVDEYAGGITIYANKAPSVEIPIRYKVVK